MIQLVLIRHANATPAAYGSRDHDRPLDSKGLRDAPDVARRVAASGVRPTLVVTSDAVRARATAEAFAAVFDAVLSEDASLYTADAGELLEVARSSGADEVAVVAHDPSITELATSLAGRDLRMGTCTAAVFTWSDGGWESINRATPDVAVTDAR